MQNFKFFNNQTVYDTYGSHEEKNSYFKYHDEESVFEDHCDGFQHMTVGLGQLPLLSHLTSSCSSIRYDDLQQTATPNTKFSINNYVLDSYYDHFSPDYEKCIVLDQLGDISLAISNNSLTKNSLQENLCEQQGHTILMYGVEEFMEGSYENIIYAKSSHFQEDYREIILDQISMIKEEDL